MNSDANNQDKKENVWINNLILELEKAKDDKDMIETLVNICNSNPEVEHHKRAGIYLYKNYYIKSGYIGKGTQFIDNMRYLEDNGYCSSSAPKVIGMPISKDKKFCVIITKINESEGGELIPYALHRTDENKRRKFARELIALLNEQSLHNPCITESYDNWYLTPKEKNIVIDHWSVLEKCASEKKKQIKKQILEVCGLTCE